VNSNLRNAPLGYLRIVDLAYLQICDVLLYSEDLQTRNRPPLLIDTWSALTPTDNLQYASHEH